MAPSQRKTGNMRWLKAIRIRAVRDRAAKAKAARAREARVRAEKAKAQSGKDNPGNFANDREKASEAGKKGGRS
jgi:general stress protein YciG